MIKIGIDPIIAIHTGYMCRWMIPAAISSAVTFQFRAFIMGQGILKPFGYASIVSGVICITISNILVKRYNLGIIVFPVCQMIIEGCNIILITFIMLFKVKKETLVCVSFNEIFEGFSEYCLDCFKFISIMVIECLQIELVVYMAGLTHDLTQTNAFVCFTNLTYLFFIFGMGFGDVIRTRVGNLIGQNKCSQAKNLMSFCLSINCICGGIICIVIVLFNYQIAGLYSHLDDVRNLLSEIMQIGIPFAFSIFFIGGTIVLMRLIGNAKKLVWMSGIGLVVFFGIGAYLLCFRTNLGVIGLVIADNVGYPVLAIAYMTVINYTDWESLSIIPI